jgi:hypothetical protein
MVWCCHRDNFIFTLPLLCVPWQHTIFRWLPGEQRNTNYICNGSENIKQKLLVRTVPGKNIKMTIPHCHHHLQACTINLQFCSVLWIPSESNSNTCHLISILNSCLSLLPSALLFKRLMEIVEFGCSE